MTDTENGGRSFSSKILPPCSTGELRTVEIDFRSDPRWEQFVNSHPEGLVYHHPAWLQALVREYKQKCLSLACENKAGQIQGVLPLFYTQGLPFGLSQLGGAGYWATVLRADSDRTGRGKSFHKGAPS